MKKLINSLLNPMKKTGWIIFLLLSVQSSTFVKPYFIVLAIMLFNLALLTNPWFNTITNKLNIHLTSKQKVFIAITNFLTAAYSINEVTKEYYRVFISVGIMIAFWIITIIYSNKNRIKRVTILDDEKYLRQKSKNVDFEKDDYKKMIKKLKQFCRQNAVYALAPVQIGIPKRIIYIKNTNEDMDSNKDSSYDEEKIYINPKIISTKGHTKFLEGCASCIKDKKTFYTCNVERPYSIKVEYYNLKGDIVKEEISGFTATIFCHEYDHLNGTLHMDRTNKKYEKTLSQMKEYRLNHPYKIISKEAKYNYHIDFKYKKDK